MNLNFRLFIVFACAVVLGELSCMDALRNTLNVHAVRLVSAVLTAFAAYHALQLRFALLELQKRVAQEKEKPTKVTKLPSAPAFTPENMLQ